MNQILILYYSRTGNTERMAKAVEEGATTVQNLDVVLRYQVKPEELAGFDGILVGVPTYHHDMTVGIKNLFEEAAVRNIVLKDKIGAAFGSYGWSGEAPRLVLEIMEHRFEMNVKKPPLLIKYAPDQAGLQKCRELGQKIAQTI